MSTIYTCEGNTNAGNTLVPNGGGVAKKSYTSTYNRIASIWRPKYTGDEAAKVAGEALKYVGYLEKKSPEQLYDFTANAGKNNYTMFADHAGKATGEKGIFANGYPWCCTFVEDVMIRALGKDRAKKLLGGWTASTTTLNGYLKNAGATKITDFSKAKYGDIIIFKNDKKELCHVGYVVTGYNPSPDPKPKKYTQDDFIKDVEKILGAKTAKEAFEKTVTISKTQNQHHKLVTPLERYMKSLGYYTGSIEADNGGTPSFGSGMESAIKKYQKNVVKASPANQDGVVTAKHATWKKLLGL